MKSGAVAGLVGIEGGVVSGVFNLESSGVEAHAMTNVTMKLEQSQPQTDAAVHLFDNWFDPIEAGPVRSRSRIHPCHGGGQLDMALSRPRYARCAKASSGEAEGAGGASGHRHGHRSRSLLGSFGTHRFRVDQPLFSRALVTGDASQAQAAREQAAAALAQAQNIPIEQAREQVAQYEQQHRQAVEQAKQKAAAAADTATKAATRAALFSVLALALGALAAWCGERAGAVDPTLTTPALGRRRRG